jgi:2-desacetyl-2-hydroxyethyl bacteriochlorophyllide A dehydrogenase
LKTITLNEPGQFFLTESDSPSRTGRGEATVRVRRVGVCGTDLHAFRGEQPFFTYPRVLGHELAVEIVEIDENDFGLKPGDRCAIEPYLNCGACIACRRGKTNCCEEMKVLGVHVDGGMRELLTVSTTQLHKSELLSLDQLALVEPLSIGAHATTRAQVEPGEFVLVVGAGPIGLSVIQFAGVSGARVIAMDINQERLSFAREHFAIEEAVPAESGVIEQIRKITGGDLPTVVVDATGNPASMKQSFSLPAPGGRLVFVGFFQGNITFDDVDAHRRELTLLCSRNATAADFQRVIRLLENGEIDIEPWITHRVSFGEDVIAQFPLWLEPHSPFIKGVIEL